MDSNSTFDPANASDQLRCNLAGYRLVEPGLVPVQQWRPLTPVGPVSRERDDEDGRRGRRLWAA